MSSREMTYWMGLWMLRASEQREAEREAEQNLRLEQGARQAMKQTRHTWR